MTPAARTQAAIELLDKIIAAARDSGAAADTLIARGFTERRYAGSKDRRAIRELIYEAIRLLGRAPKKRPRGNAGGGSGPPELAEAFDGSPYGPAAIDPAEPVAKPAFAHEWLIKALRKSDIGMDEQAALLQRAPLDVRVNSLKADADVVRAQIEGAEPIAFTQDGLRLPADMPVEQLPSFKDGEIEVQDAGSQMVSLASGARRGQHVIDLCAGGGGKTLALAAMMANQGSILACDVDRGRLQRLPPRAERAGVTIADTRLLNPRQEAAQLADQAGRADVVLIDAPCSGTGTWRRNPEARWRLTPDRIGQLAHAQRYLMKIAADLVRPGGALVYIVCSLLDEEGASQAEAFLEAYPGWKVETLSIGAGVQRGPGLRLTPLKDSTDGFFVAKMIRP